MQLIAALIAALAVILVVVAVSMPRGQAGIGDRIGGYGRSARGRDRGQVKDDEDSADVRDVLDRSQAVQRFNRVVDRQSFAASIARDLARADLALRPGEWIAVRIGLLIGLPAAAFALGTSVLPSLGNPIAWVIALLAGFWLPGFWLGLRQGRRLKAFNSALADTITLVANALRSGSSFLQAVEMVTRETKPPISTEFGRVVREVNLGLPLEMALNNMVRRVRSDDLELMTTAISIQYQVGGNLAEILDSIAFTIRERVRIKGEIRTLTAQQRMSGYVVAGLPVGLLGILNVIAPKFMEPMFMKPPEVFGLPMGVIILAVGGVLMGIGFLIIRKIVDIQV